MQARKLLPLTLSAMLVTSAGAAANGVEDHGHMWGWGWGGMIFGPIMMILFIAVAVGIVVIVLRAMGVGGTTTRAASGGKSAIDILEERFARGEIDREEFEDRKRVLTEPG